MLRLSKLFLTGAAAAALLASAPALAQAGLGSRLDAQEQQLAQAEQTCGEVNLAEYAQLLQEASKNKQRADKMAKKGVPVDQTQVSADLAKATMLFARAQAAQARHCMMQAQQQAQPQPQVKTTSAVPPAQAPQQVAMNLDPFDQRILDAQNSERAAVGAPPLKWNYMLAEHATQYAQELAKAGDLIHAPREGRGTERENLQKGLIGWSPEQIIGDWSKEKSNFGPGYWPNVARDGNWMGVAHYSQMIWPTTTDVGCGRVEALGYVWFVCRYNPGGNKDGKPVGLAIKTTIDPTPVGVAAKVATNKNLDDFIQRNPVRTASGGNTDANPALTPEQQYSREMIDRMMSRMALQTVMDRGSGSTGNIGVISTGLEKTWVISDGGAVVTTPAPLTFFISMQQPIGQCPSSNPFGTQWSAFTFAQANSLFDLYSGPGWATAGNPDAAQVDANIEPPTLPPSEVFTPDSAPRDSCQIM